MIVENEHKYNKLSIVIAIVVMVAVTIVVVNAVIATKPYYAAPGSNTETWGAPNGVYEQKDWGWFDNSSKEWFFTMCDAEGPLHGSWKVAEGVWVPVLNQTGVYPIDARLLITIQNNVIVKAEVHSWMAYGN